MLKAAIERGESDARISYPEREQARSAASMLNVQCSMFNATAQKYVFFLIVTHKRWFLFSFYTIFKEKCVPLQPENR
jgi:hypothetical protein